MIKRIVRQYRELIVYLVFGVLTTVVNLVSFYFLEQYNSGASYLINNAIAWVIAVVFAFVTNKLYVFRSSSFKASLLVREISEFLGARVFSFLVEEAGMWFFVEQLRFNRISYTVLGIQLTGEMMTKILLAVVVVIMNYFFSKYIIFKKER